MLQKLAKLLLILFVLFFTYYIFSTSLYVRFWADDFCTAAVQAQHGFLKSQIFWWTTWSGRYSYNFFLQLFMIFGEDVTKYVPFIVYSLLVVSLWPLAHILVGGKDKLFALLFTSLFIILVLIITPNIIQSFYWYGGTLIYTMPFVFLNLFLSLVAWNKTGIYKTNRTLVLIIAFILLLIAGGFNESFTMSVLIILFFGVFVLTFLSNRKSLKNIRNIVAAGICGLIASFFIMYSSPGVAARSVTVRRPDSLMWVLSSSAQDAGAYLSNLINARFFIYNIGLIFSVAYLFHNQKKLKLKFSHAASLFLIVVVATLFSTASIYFVSYYAMSYHPPERAFITSVYIMVFCLVITAILSAIYAGTILSKRKAGLVSVVAFLIFFASMGLLARDTWRRWKFLKNDLRTYADAWDIQRESIGAQAKQGERIVIDYIPPVGRIDGFKDNKGWVTGCAADYFGVEEFVVE